jgi:hypothetical protein
MPKKSQKSTASKVLAEDSLSKSDGTETDSDDDGQLFHVKVTNKLLDEEQKKKAKASKKTILNSSSSSSSSDSSDEESILELSDSPAPRYQTTSTDSDSSESEISRRFKEKNLKFKTGCSILSGSSVAVRNNGFKTPNVNNKNRGMIDKFCDCQNESNYIRPK